MSVSTETKPLSRSEREAQIKDKAGWVITVLAAMLAIDQGWQCALMAPTEILAQQHFAKLVGWLAT